jgi:uncharacterized protein (DUF2249 family)
MATDIVDLDVRPILAGGKDPFVEIMAAADALAPGQRLRIVAPFRPAPLLAVFASRGFTHEEGRLTGSDWEVIFSREEATSVGTASVQPDASAWPEPARRLDVSDLDPPEPMVQILATIEEMKEGEVLAAVLGREPLFLLPELAKRGHAWRGEFESCKAYRLLVRVGKEEKA